MKNNNRTVAPTTTSDLRRDDIYEDIIRWKHVLKWSYPKSNRISEREIIIQARKVLGRHDKDPDPSGKALTVKISNSLPDVLNGYDIDERKKILRAFLGVGYEERRILRFAIFEYLEPIHSLPDLTQFKGSVRHIALAIHYLASSEEGIKHRDINVNNLMFRRLSDGQIQGVLCDWDQASTYETERSIDHTGMRNGTRAFLSIDMHENPPPVHLERFDFESLFYVLYWISMNYSKGKFLPEKDKHLITKKWAYWNVEDDEDLSGKKVAFLHKETRLCDSPELFTPFFMPIVELWLDPLLDQFRDGYILRRVKCYPTRPQRSLYTTTVPGSNSDSILESGQTTFDNASLGGKVCFEQIWAILET